MKTNSNNKFGIMLNPFSRIAGFQALLVGFTFIAASSVFAYIFGTHFNGLLDIKFGSSEIGYHVFIIYGVINVTVVSILFYIAGRIVSKSRIRFIDVIGTQALARYPYILAPFLNINGISERAGGFIMYKFLDYGEAAVISNYELLLAAVFMLIMLLLIVWMIALMYNAYRIACNVKGANAVLSFIIVLFVAEIITLLINSIFYKPDLMNINF